MPETPRPEIPAVVVDRDLWDAYGSFNPNQFVPPLRAYCHACARALALIKGECQEVRATTPTPTEFMRVLRNSPEFEGEAPQDGPAVRAFYYRPKLIGSLNALLVATKSFFDVYSMLLARALVPSASITGFHSKGRSKPGQEFVGWLRNSVAPSEQVEKLAAIIESHLTTWLASVIRWRDEATHWGGVKGIIDMNILIDREIMKLSVDQVVDPRMPDQSTMAAFADGLFANVKRFIDDTLPLVRARMLAAGDGSEPAAPTV